MPYIPPEVVEQARQIDPLTYLQNCEPHELVRISGNNYTTRTHDSLKISNGKWMWWSRRIGGYTALDYLVKVKGCSFVEAVETLVGKAAIMPSMTVKPQQKTEPKVLFLPDKSASNDKITEYLFGRGIDYAIIQYCIDKGLIFESLPYHNLVCVGFDENNTPHYAAYRATADRRLLGDCSGSDKHYSFRIADSDSVTVHLFECAIDLLSFATLEKMEGRDWRKDSLVSLAGVYLPKEKTEESTTPAANGVYYGQNVISKNMIIADRRQLLNGNEFILGVSDGGKSFTAKGEIINQVLAGDADIIIIDPEREYSPLVRALGGEIINISATSPTHINAMDMNREYGDGANPVILKSEFIMSLCEQLIGGNNLGAVQKSIIDRCTASVYRTYQQNNYTGEVPTLQDFRAELLKQSEPEAQEIALAIELFTNGSLNTFAMKTNVDTDNRLICYDILDLGKQLMPIGMLVILDSILNRITQNRAKGKNTFIFIDEIYLLFQHEYSANFLFTLWKRVRKYGAYATGITQNVDDLLQSHTARTMLANSEFIVMLNQASTDRLELAKLLNISDTQLSYITNVDAGHGLIKVGSSLVPFANKFPKNTKLYKLMTTKLSDMSDNLVNSTSDIIR